MTHTDRLAPLLHAVHAALARAPSSGPLVVAFSGGSDSTALLHVLSHSPSARARGLRALHVDHGLAGHSAEWAVHCADACARADVPLGVLRVDVRREREGLEGAARRARYAALAAALIPGELLLTAHHADDQAETLLLRLLRGSGVHGIAAMREWRTLAPGFLVRPWLCVPKAWICAYAADMRLPSVVDPSNDDPAHDRNFLRHEVLPRLATRWPHAGEALARSAQLMQSASLALARRNSALVASLRTDDTAGLRCPPLRELDDFDLEEVLRTFVAAAGVPSPPARVLALLRSELLDAAADARPALMWRGHALRRYRDVLYLTAPLTAWPGDWEAPWDGQAPLALPGGLGTLHADAQSPLRLAVRFRRGGERMRVRDGGPDRLVKTLMQELQMPPWQRDRMPLVVDDVGVAAIGSLLVSDRLDCALSAAGARLEWRAGRG